MELCGYRNWDHEICISHSEMFWGWVGDWCAAVAVYWILLIFMLHYECHSSDNYSSGCGAGNAAWICYEYAMNMLWIFSKVLCWHWELEWQSVLYKHLATSWTSLTSFPWVSEDLRRCSQSELNLVTPPVVLNPFLWWICWHCCM